MTKAGDGEHGGATARPDKARTLLASPIVWALAIALIIIAQAIVIITGPGDPFVDDAWISLRYARNFIAGQGLVFNPDERVEGFTHPLWVLLDAVILALRLPAKTVLALLGVGAWVAAALATRRAAREAGASTESQVSAGAIVAFAAMGVFWGLSGLETAAFAWALVEGVRLACSARRGESRGISAGIVFGLACWLRPEGALALAVVLVVWVFASALDGKGLRAFSNAAKVLAAAIAVYAPWELFRLVYYGSFVPNTFLAKSGGALSWMIERGATYLLDAATEGPLVPLALTLVVVPRAFRKFEVLAPAAVALALILFTLWVGGDYLPFGRFVVPIVPLLALATANALEELTARFSLVTARVLACVACLAGLLGHLGETRVRAFENATERYGVAAAWLREHLSSEMLVATPAAGMIGWSTNLPVLDEFGLTDAYIARHLDPRLDAAKLRAPAGHERGNAEYILERSPDVVLLANVWARPIPLTAAAVQQNLAITSITDRLLFADRRFFERYEVLNYRLDDETWLGMAVRKDSVLHPSHPAHKGPTPTAVAPSGK